VWPFVIYYLLTAIWYILWPFGNLVTIWYIFTRFGILCQEKYGNPGLGFQMTYHQNVDMRRETIVNYVCMQIITTTVDLTKVKMNFLTKS
jgi:hypothetical protein